ncbi:ATP:guanido phosphotransferase [Streptococcus pneumoniae]|nr:ATP:guanido phosphotransferase [Streptococcus pneumoniae]
MKFEGLKLSLVSIERGSSSMSLDKIMNEAISPWMKGDGPDSDIVLSSRIRLARNFKQYQFSTMQNEEEAQKVQELFKKKFINKYSFCKRIITKR